jgi:hypothetical protein
MKETKIITGDVKYIQSLNAEISKLEKEGFEVTKMKIAQGFEINHTSIDAKVIVMLSKAK